MGDVIYLQAKRPNVLRHLSDQALSNALVEAMVDKNSAERRIKLFDDELRRRKSQPKDA